MDEPTGVGPFLFRYGPPAGGSLDLRVEETLDFEGWPALRIPESGESPEPPGSFEFDGEGSLIFRSPGGSWIRVKVKMQPPRGSGGAPGYSK